ncbi:MAG: YceI family protein, partial [Chloroflexi bacterium]|nr:YceI family protein [Chloroflexota bacterium]
MRLSNRALIVTVVLVLLLVAAACSSNEPEAPAAPAAAQQPTNTPVPPAEPAPAVEATAAPETEVPAAAAPQASGDAITFVVDPAQSEARFVINEELMGSPKTVVGANSGVSGEVTVNPGDPAGVEIGSITVNAGGFVTDSDRRNGAINRFILQASSYPTITFTPTAIQGVPAAVAVGDTLSLQVTGDLAIREITR